jgi:hypothetical protein
VPVGKHHLRRRIAELAGAEADFEAVALDRHYERSEAIRSKEERLDCFVAKPVIGRAYARPVGSSQ